MAKGDDDERRRALRAVPPRSAASRERSRLVELLGEIYDLIDAPERIENRRGPQQRLARDRRRARFVAAGVDVARALALAIRGR
jgi:sugar-specific transcriptional regulator TrmB